MSLEQGNVELSAAVAKMDREALWRRDSGDLTAARDSGDLTSGDLTAELDQELTQTLVESSADMQKACLLKGVKECR